MGTDSYDVIMDRVRPLYEQYPKRFMKFYNAVYLMLDEMPVGSVIKLQERCKPNSLPLLRDLVALFIMEQSDDPLASRWEFMDDYDTVRRTVDCHPMAPRPLPRWNPKTTEQ